MPTQINVINVTLELQRQNVSQLYFNKLLLYKKTTNVRFLLISSGFEESYFPFSGCWDVD